MVIYILRDLQNILQGRFLDSLTKPNVGYLILFIHL